ncbi:ATP phosphoribosyltransferase regulatory subunit [Heyndrickxia sp. NPDC080065]|uniref:ATP phosphoribosyltransferase regulatory subunit n=1 Tax=Heyndrickxia sp. NPDC080065 TaxID=3390568 RepID=UPI003D06C373
MMFLPSGSKDDIGRIVSSRNRVFEVFRQVISNRGFHEISTPAVEYADTFTNKHVGMSLQGLLKWFNRDGAIEVLRPDWTTAIARALAKQSHHPQKWAYQGSVFRSDKPGMEMRQAGIEIVDYPPFLGESECLLMAIDFLEGLNIEQYLIELGHTGIFDELTKQLTLSEEEMEALRLAMHDKRKDEVYKLALNKGHLDIAEELLHLVDAYGSFTTILMEYEQRWEKHPKLLNILKHLKKVADMLDAIGGEEVIVDLGKVKKLPYYSGIMFRGFLKETGATCFSGGRYDQLYDQFGQRRSAVGLAFDVDVLSEQIDIDPKKETICIIASDEKLVYAEKLRQQFKNSIVDIQYEVPEINSYDKVLYINGSEGRYEVN